MTILDSNQIVRAYLASGAGATAALVALVGTRIYSPRLPENCPLPALSLFTRGGTSTPYIPDVISPSKQFDCWGSSPIVARQVYRTLYDSLQGIQNVKITISGVDYFILSVREEVQGQDLQDELQGYFRVLTFFEIMVR